MITATYVSDLILLVIITVRVDTKIDQSFAFQSSFYPNSLNPKPIILQFHNFYNLFCLHKYIFIVSDFDVLIIPDAQ